MIVAMKALDQRLFTCGPRTSGGPRLFKKLNSFSSRLIKYMYTRKQNLKFKILKRFVKVKEFEI
jgi:hypothetical protein